MWRRDYGGEAHIAAATIPLLCITSSSIAVRMYICDYFLGTVNFPACPLFLSFHYGARRLIAAYRVLSLTRRGFSRASSYRQRPLFTRARAHPPLNFRIACRFHLGRYIGTRAMGSRTRLLHRTGLESALSDRGRRSEKEKVLVYCYIV